VEERFLTDSAEAQVAVEQERRKHRLIRILSIISTVAAVVSLYLFVAARRPAQIAFSRGVAVRSSGQTDSARPPLLTLSAIEGACRGGGKEALHAAAKEGLGSLGGQEKRIHGVPAGRDGSSLETAGDDGTALLWNVETDERKPIMNWKGGGVLGVSISPDGKL